MFYVCVYVGWGLRWRGCFFFSFFLFFYSFSFVRMKEGSCCGCVLWSVVLVYISVSVYPDDYSK